MNDEIKKNQSYYFYVSVTIEIESLDQLAALAKIKNEKIDADGPPKNVISTQGLYRGQSKEYPLIPKTYRGKFRLSGEIENDTTKQFAYFVENQELSKFIEIGRKQNKDFPTTEVQQMVLAQHYGIATPLLDWTKNILVAVYFALDLKLDIDNGEEPCFIYHIASENLLTKMPETDFYKINDLCYVIPGPIDRRVVRQHGCFTFHPNPKQFTKDKIPVVKYVLNLELKLKLWKFLESIGLTSHYLFPDYAGLANFIQAKKML